MKFKSTSSAQYQYCRHNLQRQQGVVIIMALIILMILSILGISSMSSSTMQERMSANTRDRHIAFQAAEAALRAAEREIEAGLNPPTGTTPSTANAFSDDCTNGLCNCYRATTSCLTSGNDYWEDATVNAWNISTHHREYVITIAEVASNPKYIIEFITYLQGSGGTTTAGGPGDPEIYRVTALGFGQSMSSRVMLQTTYKKQ